LNSALLPHRDPYTDAEPHVLAVLDQGPIEYGPLRVFGGATKKSP
jgi:hypothetical protein